MGPIVLLMIFCSFLRAEPREHQSTLAGAPSSVRSVERMQEAVSVCLVSDGDFNSRLASGDIAAVIGNACKLQGAERGVNLKLNSELKALISEPVVISEGRLCDNKNLKSAQGNNINSMKVNPNEEYLKILEKKLVKYCIQLICKEKELGDTCNLNSGAVTVPPKLIDTVVKAYQAEVRCKKSDILQINR